MQTRLILFTTRAPHELTDVLTLTGYRVYEALAISEVLHLIETEDVDAVVVTGDVAKSLGAIQEMRVTVKLNEGVAAADVIWELSCLLPALTTIQ
jgi:metallophosphoesterase superfamily enzyme